MELMTWNYGLSFEEGFGLGGCQILGCGLRVQGLGFRVVFGVALRIHLRGSVGIL